MLRIWGLVTPFAASVIAGKLRPSVSINSSTLTRAPIAAEPLRGVLMTSSSLMSLMLTTRFGVTMKSFISESRSVPPARTSVSPQETPSNATACSLVVGLAYSNFCTGPSFLFERREHAVGSQRESGHADADGVGHRVRDRRARRDGRRFAHADDAAFVVTFARHHVNLEIADVGQSRESVELHVRVEHPAGLRVHDLLFVERVGNAHDHRAEDLSLAGLHVNDQSAILHGDEVVHLDDARLDIHRNIGHLHAAYSGLGQCSFAGVGVLAARSERLNSQLRASLLPGHAVSRLADFLNLAAHGFQLVDRRVHRRSDFLK